MTTPPPKNARPSDVEYRRRSFREIWLPLIITLSLLGGLAILSIVLMATPDTTEGATKWSHISTLYLTLILCGCNLVPLAILGGLVYLMTKAPGGVTNLGNSLQDTAENISNKARNLSDKLAKPVVTTSSKAASFNTIFRRIFRRGKSKPENPKPEA